MKDKLNKKTLIIGGSILLLIFVIILVIGIILKPNKDIVDIGDIMDEQSSQKTEEQLQLHHMITRNTTWETTYDEILAIEEGNVLDYQENLYMTVDYETMFNLKVLPTYLFDKGTLVGVLYEADLTAEDTEAISLIHQDFAVNIHYIYENLYRENNKWSSGQERKYDTQLWSNAILDGNLTLQSIWNSNDEKVFLLTNKSSYFDFLENNKERILEPSLTFIVLSDNYLKNGTLKELIDKTSK